MEMVIKSEDTLSGSEKLTILIVDDEPHILEFLQMGFNYEGFHVLTATSGQQALSMAASCHPDLIILDIMMPVLDGIEVTRQLRRGNEIPIIWCR
jgi:DNA-binding response OmpR family regulator